MGVEAQPLRALRRAADLEDLPPGPVVVAVSGGLDSMTLMHAMVRLGLWEVEVVTVDHQLQAGSETVAQAVVTAARQLGCAAL